MAKAGLGRGVFMVTWREWPTDSPIQHWDETLNQAADQSVFQSFRWGEYKRQERWVPLRLVALGNDGTAVAMAQVLVKHYVFGICICWVPGGPVIDFGKKTPPPSDIIEALLNALQQRFKHLYVRLQPGIAHTPDLSYGMMRAGLQRPSDKLSSGYTVLNKLDLPAPDLLANMTSKHRYYTKRARSAGLAWEITPSAEAIRTLVELNLEVAHRTRVSWMATSEKNVQGMCLAMQNEYLIVIGREQAKAACACLVLLSGQHAFYMIAGTSELGRRFSASYAMFEQLALALKSRGIRELDFGGIDPVSTGAQGVNHFKLGFGGQVKEYLGEWEWASNPLLARSVNFAVSRTMRRS